MQNNKVILTEKDRMEKKEGRLFIVPNKMRKVSDLGANMSEAMLDTFPGLKLEDKVVQVWVSDKPEGDNFGEENMAKGKESNWSSHRNDDLPFSFHGFKKGYFLNYLPFEWLEGKKENDVLDISIYDRKFVDCEAQYKLVCKQQDSRYEGFGSFEETLKRIYR